MKPLITFSLFWILLCRPVCADDGSGTNRFSPETDLLSLHYDHAPDKDDGQSAAADRTLLQSLYGTHWIRLHVVAVSGAYGENAGQFNPDSDAVMDAAWNDCGGWLAAHTEHAGAVEALTASWKRTLQAGGDVWVKEGGQSDITAVVVKTLQQELPDLDARRRIHVVQHSDWNENQTTPAALSFVKQNTGYIRIRDANAYLNLKGGDESFVSDATAHPVYGTVWKAAFKYYPPTERLDFSDTGELMYILGLGELNCEAFHNRYLHQP